jgi:rRNA maturation endonuclease Nob1
MSVKDNPKVFVFTYTCITCSEEYPSIYPNEIIRYCNPCGFAQQLEDNYRYGLDG